MGDMHKKDERITEGTHELDAFKGLVIRQAGNPVVTQELQHKYAGQFVAFSISDNKPQWGEKGAALTRKELSEKMDPLKNGVDYYAHSIE